MRLDSLVASWHGLKRSSNNTERKLKEGKHVIVWVAATESKPSSRWFKMMYNSKEWLSRRAKLRDKDSFVERTDLFSEAYVFNSFEEAHEVYSAASVQQVLGGKMFIRYYSDKDYFKEKLSRE